MYKIEYLDSVKENLKSVSKTSKNQIRKAIEKKLVANPIEFGKPLQYSQKELRRLRVGDHRRFEYSKISRRLKAKSHFNSATQAAMFDLKAFPNPKSIDIGMLPLIQWFT